MVKKSLVSEFLGSESSGSCEKSEVSGSWLRGCFFVDDHPNEVQLRCGRKTRACTQVRKLQQRVSQCRSPCWMRPPVQEK